MVVDGSMRVGLIRHLALIRGTDGVTGLRTATPTCRGICVVVSGVVDGDANISTIRVICTLVMGGMADTDPHLKETSARGTAWIVSRVHEGVHRWVRGGVRGWAREWDHRRGTEESLLEQEEEPKAREANMAVGEGCMGAGGFGEAREWLWERSMEWRECLHGAVQIAWMLICGICWEELPSTLHLTFSEEGHVRIVHRAEARH